MMTVEERLKMYRDKKNFVFDVSMAFIKNPTGHSVDDAIYEVFFRETEHETQFAEWLTIKYYGGAKAHRMISGNSNSANFEQIAKMIYGGCYEYNGWYECLASEGWKKLNLAKMCVLQEME